MKFLLVLAVLLYMASCNSRTGPSQRYQDSASSLATERSIALSSPDEFTFAAVGDLHIIAKDVSRLERILDAATAANDSLLLLLGDIVDQGLSEDYDAVMNSLRKKGWDTRTITTVGNHDVFGSGWDGYRQNFGSNHVAVNLGKWKIISFDTADAVVGAEQAEWLDTQTREGEAKVIWISHYLPVIPGIQTYLKLANEKESLERMKAATRLGVKAWMGAHYHSYVESEIAGVKYLVAGGGGGRRMHPVERNFFVRGKVKGDNLEFEMVPVE